MADDDGVIVAGGYTGTELFAVLLFKVFRCGDKDIRCGVKLQILRAPLFREMIRNNDQRLVTQTETLALLRDGNGSPSLACADYVSQQNILAIQPTGDCVKLMRAQDNLRVHTRKHQMATVILPWTGGIEAFIVELHQPIPSLRAGPDPVLKRLLDGLLLCLCQRGFLLIQNRLSLSVSILNIIEDFNLAEIQCLLNELVGVDAIGSIGAAGVDIPAVIAFTVDIPLGCER